VDTKEGIPFIYSYRLAPKGGDRDIGLLIYVFSIAKIILLSYF